MIKLNKLILAALSLALIQPAFSQAKTTDAKETSVSVSASGTDVRTVLHDLFAQVKKNYVIEPGIRFALYLNLEKVDFDEALGIVSHQAKLKIELQNGIYFVSPAPTETAKPVVKVEPKVEPKPPVKETPKPVTETTLRSKIVTTRLSKTDIRKVFAELQLQSEITITVDSSVPNYKLDAFLIKTSLKYALDRITSAAGLKVKLNPTGVTIYKEDPEDHVSLSQ